MEYFSDSSDILTENDIISASSSTEFDSSAIEIVYNNSTRNTLQLFDAALICISVIFLRGIPVALIK